MDATRWLYDQATADDATAWRSGGAAWCYLCGSACPDRAPSQPMKVAMRDTFTNHDLARRRDSGWVCPACSWYLDTANGQRLGWLTHAWRVTPQEHAEWPRTAWRGDLDTLLLDGVALDAPTVFSITTSYKKHLLLLAPVTHDARRLAVQFEQQTVWLTPDLWRAMTGPFDALRVLGHSKAEILSGVAHPAVLARHGRIGYALALLSALAPYRGGLPLALLTHIAPALAKHEEETDDRSGDPGDGGGDPALPVGRDQPGVQEQVPAGHLGAGAESDDDARAHGAGPRHVAQQTLFDL